MTKSRKRSDLERTEEHEDSSSLEDTDKGRTRSFRLIRRLCSDGMPVRTSSSRSSRKE